MDDENLLRPALPVEDYDDSYAPDDSMPVTAEEYLRRVRWEARQCPDVMVADIDSKKLARIQPNNILPISEPLEPAFAALLPDRAWETEFLAWFSDLRQALIHLAAVPFPAEVPKVVIPPMADSSGWRSLCFGRKARTKETESGFTLEHAPSAPLLSIMLRLDHVAVCSLLEMHIEWLETKEMTTVRAQWLFGLLARLDRLLHADTAASLTALLRRCHALRSACVLPQDNVPLATLNVLITILNGYFEIRLG
mmetsp:Transcript_10459/g.17105  ORF Transcript_10459/g.17105 Transcript_10459/m.17105 type:complete len:252 (-) Transcript_10459:683-1438(-)|eukprot:CAMPEP_0184669588 /NCGR_PEP_ID=MMETSP0308-20130426/78084_1 /TAXON_ID=38269 /ORGANISM="Gloeochaete witrockiana, Strain SAG 46.84" /LENGTH=251 /DNA_ID=CAMNT_0027115927 /DNA_START=30 /DNA_END=785 /DNA_ORIENTATION=-